MGVGAAYARAALGGLDGTRRRIFEALRDPAIPCDTPASAGAFYYFVTRPHGARFDDDGGTADSRASGRGDPGLRVRRDGRLYLRISYGALDAETVHEGIARLTRGLQQLA